jgi:uncharacterized protein YraI
MTGTAPNEAAVSFRKTPKVRSMTLLLKGAAAAAILCAAAFPAVAAGECLVDDPTGTPLNVRSAPNGTIVTTLGNGTRLEVIEERKIGTKPWLFVTRQGERLGWVFGAYVVCPKAGDVRALAPSQPAEQR